MWKILTEQIREKIYYSLTSRGIFPDEQKGWRRGGTEELPKIPDQIVQFIEKTMQTWRVELTAGGQSLAEVKIQRGVFQRDALSPLLLW